VWASLLRKDLNRQGDDPEDLLPQFSSSEKSALLEHPWCKWSLLSRGSERLLEVDIALAVDLPRNHVAAAVATAMWVGTEMEA